MTTLLDTATGEITVIEPMTREEAQQHVDAIHVAASNIGRHLLEIKQREGWRALGYETWTAFLIKEFSYSRKHLYELMNAATVEGLLPEGNTKAAYALTRFDANLQPAIAEIAKSAAEVRGRDVTAGLVTAVGNVLAESVATGGYVDTGSGTMTAMTKAISTAIDELDKRKSQHIDDNSNWQRVGVWLGSVAAVSDVEGLAYVTMRVPVEAVPVLQELCDAPVKVGVYREKEEQT